LIRTAAGGDVYIVCRGSFEHTGQPVIILTAERTGIIVDEPDEVYLIAVAGISGDIIAVILLRMIIQLAAVHHLHLPEIGGPEAGSELCFEPDLAGCGFLCRY